MLAHVRWAHSYVGRNSYFRSAYTTVGLLELHLRATEQKCANMLHKRKGSTLITLSKTLILFEIKSLLRNRDQNMTQNECLCAICCRSERASDVISGENVNAMEGYALLKFETAGLSIFGENQNHSFA